MRRALKWLAFAIVGLIFLISCAFGAAYYYKSDILEAVNKELTRSINGDVHLSDITFSFWEETPGVAITLHDFYIRGPQYDLYKKDFLNARKVYVNVRLWPLLRKTIAIRSITVTHGEIAVFRTKSGYTNLDWIKKSEIRKDSTVTETPVLVLFHKGKLEDVQFSFYDSLKGKSIAFHVDDLSIRVTQNDSSKRYDLEGPVKFETLTLNPKKGSYLKDRPARVHWNLEFLPITQQLILHPSSMEFDKSKIDLSGNFDFGSPGTFQLNINSESLDYAEGVSLLTEALQSKLTSYAVDHPIQITTTLDGQFTSGSDPAVDIKFKITNSHVQAHSISLEKVTAEGTFTNHLDNKKEFNDHNSQLTITNFDGVYRGFPTQATAKFVDLIDPHLDFTSSNSLDLREFKTLADSSRFAFLGGQFDSQISYSGKLKELLDSTTKHYEGKLTGTFKVTGGSARYVPRKTNYEKIEMLLNFNQEHIIVNNLSFDVNKNPIKISGEVTGFAPLYVEPTKKGRIKLDVYSPYLNFSTLLAKPPAGKVVANKSKEPNLIDRLYAKAEVEMNVQLDKVSYQNLNGYKVKGQVALLNDNLEAKNFKMNLADGDISFLLKMTKLQNPVNPVYIQSIVRHADIKKFFYSFNNFKLTTITHENLEGKIDMNVWFTGRVDDDFNIFMPGMSADVDFSIKKGRLLNFEPLQNMSNFLFKKRDFTDVQFGEIKSHLAVRGTEMDISKMEIESTVLRLFIEGRYSLKNNTDLEVQVPLSNLKKRDKDYTPENVGIDSKVGPSIYLHVTQDETGKTVIAYDPFKKHVRKAASKKK